MEERAERAVDERGRLVELEVADVAEPEVEVGVERPRLFEHRGRRVDADHGPPGGARDLGGDAARADGELDDRPVRLLRERDVERDVLGHRGRPLLVAVGEGLREAHRAILRVMATRANPFMQPRLESGASR